ncbi:MAG: flavodoxin family protein [Deltaproteobacteria bacterium]|jgi:multimeric flavodoxin WrbA|nr:flavodoxin family protein [Deltaproteobacteria bacterium]
MVLVLGFSGSPIKNGNIESGLKAVLKATEAETEFIRLYDYELKICRGCKKCVKTNRCVMDDGLNHLLNRITEAQGVILSGFPSFGSVNAMTKVFIERNWPLRHKDILTQGKVGASVICGSHGLESLAAYFKNYFEGYLGIRYQGELIIKGNVPCLSCGYGENCPGSGFLREYGPGSKVTPDKFRSFETDPVAQAQAKQLGQAIGAAIG